MPERYYTIRTADPEVERMLKDISREDMRPISKTIALLVRREWERRQRERNREEEKQASTSSV